MPRRDTRPVLPVPMPVCPKCDTQITAMLCQASPRTEADVAAIQALLLEMHDRLAHSTSTLSDEGQVTP